MGPGDANALSSEAAGGPPVVGAGMDRARAALKGKRALVVGLGRTGLSVTRFLSGCGALVTATDIREASEIDGAGELVSLGVRLVAGGHDPEELKGAELVVVSPGVPYKSPLLIAAKEAGSEVVSEIELASRFIDCPVIAVAGTNGKSTVTELLGRVFDEAGTPAFVGGNLGTPAMDFVASGAAADVCVLEVSSFQLELVESFRPRVAVLLNITEDHLDRYDGFDEYADTKFRLFENQTAADCAVVNAADPVIAARIVSTSLDARITRFSSSERLSEGLYLDATDIVYVPCPGAEPERYPVAKIALKGLHNMENCMAAIAAARLSGVSREAVQRALEGFTGLAHRMQLVRTLNGVDYIDDSKGTNVGALLMALKGMDTPVVLIAGGKDKGGDYGVLKEAVQEKVKRLILIGEAAPAMSDALGPYVDVVMAATLKEAVAEGRKAARSGDTVLLSPACSSFDMFSSYKERGDRFKEFVDGLK